LASSGLLRPKLPGRLTRQMQMTRTSPPQRIELTTRGIKSLDPLKADIHWDPTLTGFGLRTRRKMHTNGWRWIASYRAGKGREATQVKLSQPFSKLTPEQARRWAHDILKKSNTADDVRTLRLREAAERDQQRALPTMQMLWEEYRRAEGCLKKSISSYDQLWRAHISPHFASTKVKAITPNDVERFKAKLADTPGAANRALALLSRLFTLAIRWGYRAGCAPEHPVKGVVRYPERQSEFFFTTAELGRIIREANADDHRAAGLAIEMLARTGARVGEVVGAHWRQFEWDCDQKGGALWTVESSNTKTKRPIARYIDPGFAMTLRKWMPLSQGLQSSGTIQAFPSVGHNQWVFPQLERPDKHLKRLTDVWCRVKARAGIQSGRIHDLRHTAATIALRATGSLSAVQSQLGHATPLTTRRYAHLMREGMIEMGALLGKLADDAHTRAAKGSVVISQRGRS